MDREQEIMVPVDLPILPLKETVVFPYLIVPLIVASKKGVKLIDDVLTKEEKVIGLFTLKDPQVEDPSPDDIYAYGCAATILKMLRFPDGSLRVLVQGIARIKIEDYIQSEPYYKARIRVVEDKVDRDDMETEALMRNVLGLFQKLVSLAPYLPDDIQPVAMNINDPSKLADFIASNVNIDVEKKIDLLGTSNVKKRLKKLIPILNREIGIFELSEKIKNSVRSELDKDQREFFLREQLKAIQKELGIKDERLVEVEEFKEKIAKAKMPEEVEKIALKEVERLSVIPVQAAEYTVVRTYLDWLVSLPWAVETRDNLDLQSARSVLEADHYDLEEVKERILEYLAVRKLKKGDVKGPILCFLGPPGVGKTSLGRSIARALGRRFVRFSLGGVKDEAEIRGHRRTYVGALPGRIIQEIRRAGTKNPVFMLDEIDKVGIDFRGDPASALLEVLDPEQNFSFMDHYLDVPFDLSKVMFITTANRVDTIPPALRDRMEIIELPGYTYEEKLQIAKKFLVPRQLKENGLSKRMVKFEDSALMKIAREYTMEAGVRNLEREIASVIRKVAVKVAEGNSKAKRWVITPLRVRRLLGPPKYHREVLEKRREVGVAVGLAWTPTGGEILLVEATRMRGKKGLTLTGQLGDIMQESATAALSYIRSNAKRLKLDEGFFEHCDLHIHVPAGAIPKDGPSAGVTIATALVSVLTGIPVRHDVAMTGEITLRGKVLPVGGIREKVLAAKRAGVRKVVIPYENKGDLERIPEINKKGLEFIFAKRVWDVFEAALVEVP